MPIGRATFATVLLAVLATGALFALYEGGWPGQPNGCRDEMRPACFCERPRPEGVAQPANTWSNLGFVAAGLAIAIAVDRRRAAPGLRAAPANPMTTTSFYPTLYAAVVALLGPGSMALHATLTRWGGRVDVMSMYLFIAFLVSYAWMRAFAWGRGAFLAAYGVLLLLLGWSKLAAPVSSDVVFGGMIGLAALSDGLAARRRPELRRDRRWLLAGGALFGTAFAIWLPSRSGGRLCDPDSLVQGHALWHLLCAGATLALYAYLRSEEAVRPERAAGDPPALRSTPPRPRPGGPA